MWKNRLRTVPSLFLVANSISWFSLTLVLIIQLLPSEEERIVAISASYFGGLILSSFIGGTLLKDVLLKKKYLLIWNLLGVFSCLFFYLFYNQANLATLIFLSSFLSISAGLGIPSSLALFSFQSKSEKRGRLGAAIFFAIQILTAFILLPLDGQATEIQFLILAFWRLLGAAGLFFYLPPKKVDEEQKTNILSIIRERRFFLLFLPWFMFSLINFIMTPALESAMGQSTYTNYVLVTSVVSSVAAIAGGFICDFKGRKMAAIGGFIFLGIGYAFLSIFSGSGNAAYYSFMFFDGVAWGFLYITFVFVIWGDLSEGSNQSREKYYVLGGLPFLLSGLIQVIVQQFASSTSSTPLKSMDLNIAFSFASFFLFVAILPLVYAPETLSEKMMKERELNSYIHKALDAAKKKKGTKKQDRKSKTKSSSHEEEARKLAEKYY